MTLMLPVQTPAPYVYVDNRAIVISNGVKGVLFSRALTRWLSETLDILAEEKRGTRMQQQHVFGGHIAETGEVVVFAGSHDDVVSVQLSAEAFASFQEELRHN
jgi:1,4-alpha-glucan branching enzyme